LRKNKTVENRAEFKYALAKYQSGRYSDSRPGTSQEKNIFDRLSKKNSFLYYEEIKDTGLESSEVLRPSSANFKREVNRSYNQVYKKDSRNPKDSGDKQGKSHSQFMQNSRKDNKENVSDLEDKKKRIASN